MESSRCTRLFFLLPYMRVYTVTLEKRIITRRTMNIGEAEFIVTTDCIHVCSVVIPAKITAAISLRQIIFVHKSLLRYTFLITCPRVILGVQTRIAL